MEFCGNCHIKHKANFSFNQHTYYRTQPRCRVCVDDVPIIAYKDNEGKGVPYLKSQPMGIYSTLWEAENWATRGSLEKIESPFYAYYKEYDIEGCAIPGNAACTMGTNWWDDPYYQQLDPMQACKYRLVRLNHMIYDYCQNAWRVFDRGTS